MKKHLFYLFAIVFFVAFAENDGSPGLQKLEYSHYDIQLKIVPAEQFIKVSGSLKYLVEQDSLDELSITLNKKMTIRNFSVNGNNTYRLDTSNTSVRWLPDAMKIIYSTENKIYKGEILNVEFSYDGRITEWPEWSANVITSEWIEMGLYFPWYPSIYGLFTYTLSVDIEPGYKIFAIGKSLEQDNKIIFETEFPVYDLIICASKDLTIRETQILNRSFKIVSCTLSEVTIDSIQADVTSFYKLYGNWFGPIQSQNMCLVASRRDKGGGYTRIGGLFLGGLSDSSYLNERTDYISYIAHEIAHLWWYGAQASTWEDWLNESFAEYSAMKVIKELRGEEEYITKLNKKKSESSNIPPIWGMSRNDPSAEKVLYNKGVVLLSEFEEKIGSDKFLELCRARIDSKANNTSDFLNLLEDIRGKEFTDWFEQSLKNR